MFWTMKQVINTKFKDLKNTSVRMRTLVKSTLGSDSNSRTSFDDLGVIGLDWDSFLEEYHKEFGVELHGLKYSDYFQEEIPTLRDMLLFPFRFGGLIIFTIIGRRDLIKQKPQLTVGDLIVSVHAGRFAKREDTEIREAKTYGPQHKL